MSNICASLPLSLIMNGWAVHASLLHRCHHSEVPESICSLETCEVCPKCKTCIMLWIWQQVSAVSFMQSCWLCFLLSFKQTAFRGFWDWFVQLWNDAKLTQPHLLSHLCQKETEEIFAWRKHWGISFKPAAAQLLVRISARSSVDANLCVSCKRLWCWPLACRCWTYSILQQICLYGFCCTYKAIWLSLCFSNS